MEEQRLIDANELKKKFSIECAGECSVCKYNKNNDSCKLFEDAPTVDAVPIARLADLCERWNWDCAMCPHLDCDKCALRSCIDELKEIINNSTRKDGDSDADRD